MGSVTAAASLEWFRIPSIPLFWEEYIIASVKGLEFENEHPNFRPTYIQLGRVRLKPVCTRWRKWRRNWRMELVASTLTLPRNMVYPALLPLMHTPRLPAVDWTDAPTDLNGIVYCGKNQIWFLRVCHHISNASARCSYSVARVRAQPWPWPSILKVNIHQLSLSLSPVTCQTKLRYIDVVLSNKIFIIFFNFRQSNLKRKLTRFKHQTSCKNE